MEVYPSFEHVRYGLPRVAGHIITLHTRS
jgi:hypothetical protein